MIGRARDLCRLHWDHARQENETVDGLKQGHWVVVLGKVSERLFIFRLFTAPLKSGALNWRSGPPVRKSNRNPDRFSDIFWNR